MTLLADGIAAPASKLTQRMKYTSDGQYLRRIASLAVTALDADVGYHICEVSCFCYAMGSHPRKCSRMLTENFTARHLACKRTLPWKIYEAALLTMDMGKMRNKAAA